LQYLDKERCELVDDNIRFLQGNPDLFQEIIRYHQEFRYPEIPDLDSDAILYQMGFLSRDDRELCRRFHAGSMDEKIGIQGRFSTQYTRELAARVISRNYPESQTKTFSKDFEKYMEKVNPQDSSDALCDYKGGKRTTPKDALLEISELRKENSLDDEQLRLLDELEGHLKERF
jgi:exodeoxyribonuclease-1